LKRVNSTYIGNLSSNTLKMSEHVECNLYLQLSDKQKAEIISQFTNLKVYEDGGRDGAIIAFTTIDHTELHDSDEYGGGWISPDDVVHLFKSFKKKYPLVWENTCSIDYEFDVGGNDNSYYGFFIEDENPKTIIQCLESMNIDQLANDKIDSVVVHSFERVDDSPCHDYRYLEVIMEYDYDDEKWLKEPLMDDTNDDETWIRGEIN